MACPVWHSGITLSQSRSLERVQQIALATISNWGSTHTQLLADFGLEKLHLRRDTLCLRFARETATDSRHKDLFEPVRSSGRNNKVTYREQTSRTSGHFNSALPYLTRIMNRKQ